MPFTACGARVRPSSPMLQAARNRSGPISPRSNGATKMPSGRRAKRRSRLVLRSDSGRPRRSSPSSARPETQHPSCRTSRSDFFSQFRNSRGRQRAEAKGVWGYSSAPALTQAIVYSPRPKLIALIALLRPPPGSPSIRFPQEKIPRSLSAGNIFAAQIFTGAGNSPGVLIAVC